MTAPPIGYHVNTLPYNPYRVVMPRGYTSTPYYYHYGTFYAPPGDGYNVVDAPGARVDALPYGYEEVTLHGEEYYRLDTY